MVDLTDKEKEDCQKILDRLVNYWWTKLKARMNEGETFEEASKAIQKEFLDDST